MRRRPLLCARRGFTLVEMLVVMVIIALLAGLALPSFQRATDSAKSTRCASNLRTIGESVIQATSDNDNQYPAISQTIGVDPYAGTTITAKNMYDTLSPYGVTTDVLRCPSDSSQVGSTSPVGFQYTVNGKQYVSSYEWNPIFDDEVTTQTIAYWNGVPIPVSNSHVRLCTDINANHNGRPNLLYGDGHVRRF